MLENLTKIGTKICRNYCLCFIDTAFESGKTCVANPDPRTLVWRKNSTNEKLADEEERQSAQRFIWSRLHVSRRTDSQPSLHLLALNKKERNIGTNVWILNIPKSSVVDPVGSEIICRIRDRNY